jgi:signal transduction histidine kinase
MKFIQIHFKDNGIGIPDPMKKRLMNGILENKERVKGLGLGLLTVKKLIQQYNGKFIIKDRVKGTYSKGTDMVIELPLHSQK